MPLLLAAACEPFDSVTGDGNDAFAPSPSPVELDGGAAVVDGAREASAPKTCVVDSPTLHEASRLALDLAAVVATRRGMTVWVAGRGACGATPGTRVQRIELQGTTLSAPIDLACVADDTSLAVSLDADAMGVALLFRKQVAGRAAAELRRWQHDGTQAAARTWSVAGASVEPVAVRRLGQEDLVVVRQVVPVGAETSRAYLGGAQVLADLPGHIVALAVDTAQRKGHAAHIGQDQQMLTVERFDLTDAGAWVRGGASSILTSAKNPILYGEGVLATSGKDFAIGHPQAVAAYATWSAAPATFGPYGSANARVPVALACDHSRLLIGYTTDGMGGVLGSTKVGEAPQTHALTGAPQQILPGESDVVVLQVRANVPSLAVVSP